MHPRTLINDANGTFDLEQMKKYIRSRNDAHYPWTKLVCIENTHNFCGGKVVPLKFLAKVRNGYFSFYTGFFHEKKLSSKY